MKTFRITKDAFENAKVLKQIPYSNDTRIILNTEGDSVMLEFANNNDMEEFGRYIIKKSRYDPQIVKEIYTHDEEEN